MQLTFDATKVPPFIPFVIIHFNGSRWAGEAPGDINELFHMLATHPLDATFEPERYGNFAYEPRNCREAGTYGKREYIDEGPCYPTFTMRFWGNFFTYSHCFMVDTNKPELIEQLTKAIRQNQQRLDYLMQKVP